MQNCKTKKINGFTLSEVLITLAVIGVVAAMVIPAVQTYTIKKTFTSKFLKAYQTLCSATEKVKLQSGGTLDSSVVGHYNDVMRNTYRNYYSVTNPDTVWYDENSFYSLDGTPYTFATGMVNAASIITTDGMLWGFRGFGYGGHCGYDAWGMTNVCGIVGVDLNALKGPNRLGVDIHEFFVTEEQVLPVYAKQTTVQKMGKCRISNTGAYNGRACGYFILRDGAMNYLDGDLDNYD